MFLCYKALLSCLLARGSSFGYLSLFHRMMSGVVPVNGSPELCSNLSNITNKDLLRKVHHSIDVIEKAVETYKMDSIPLSFNGGKDCCVLLHLLYIVLAKRGLFSQLKVLHFSHPKSFSEVNTFVATCVYVYGLNLETLPPLSHTVLQQQVDKLAMKAIFMGTRSTDPRSSTLQDFAPTDPGWPQIMRVNPILGWDYDDVWHFILALKVPYCELYDRGYTSIGAENDTLPNPELKQNDGSYSPAFKLKDGTKERAGRLKG
jgi:FAD synthetase